MYKLNMKLKLLFLILIISLLFSGCSSVSVSPSNIVNTDFNTDMILRGEMYATHTTINISNGETVYLKANSSNVVHLIERLVYAETTGTNLDYDIVLYENGTDSGASNILNNYNVNRNHIDISNFKIYTNVTNFNCDINCNILPFGISILSDKKHSDTTISNTEYILRNNTNYYLGITNNDGGVLSISLKWLFYEE